MTELTPQLSTLADELLQVGCIKFGEFTLKSGLNSPIYIDLRRIISYPSLLQRIGEAYLPLLENLQFSRLAGLPYAAIPIATAICLQGNYPMAEIEGEFHSGETAVVIDDLTTTGGSKFEAIEKLTAAGLKVSNVVVLVDRESGAREALEKEGLKLHAVLSINQLLDHWERTAKVDQSKIEETRRFLKST
jgi:uridine monophosphate synthetase